MDSLEVRQPWSNSARTTPTMAARSASMRASIACFSADSGRLKNGIQAEVSTMTTPQPLALRLGLHFLFFELAPVQVEVDLARQRL